ncbi:serine/threonine-protein kinase [Plantactinospora endophytica]|uniref:DUF2157 domain-containing protein n=1 Tax=Plantactinospora endophytica TaxID=673535 RepID=A0ABQ4E699_9ACTN|nr:GlsB/YeaQ/YmgE family stress response membrane protein [Plantactinospora endophytica]GIG90199.1 hypothetical protein Pen02_51350 [Plantactinospora endophytica]
MTRHPDPVDGSDGTDANPTNPGTPTDANPMDLSTPTDANLADPGTPTEQGILLERRYRRLLHLYPAGYRAERSDELVGTYLELADPQRRWPSPADTADVLRGGLRQRLREQGASGLIAGLPIAAVTALGTLTALAVFLLHQVEFTPVPDGVVWPQVGRAQTLGVFVWIGWLLAGLATAVLPARWARWAVGVAVLLTLATPLASALTGLPRPPLFVLLPTLALGLTALALPDRPGWSGRTPPVLGVLAGAGVAVLFQLAESGGDWFTSYYSTQEVLVMASGLVLGLVLALGLVRALTGNGDALWAFLLLLTPVGLLGVRQLTEAYWWRTEFPQLAATAGALTLFGVGTLLAAVAVQGARHRATRRRLGAGPCPMCGHVSEVARSSGAASPDTVS